MVTKKEGRCISKKCLALVNRLKQDQPMNTKKLICILAGAALLVSCTEEKKTNAPATTATRPIPTPRPRPTRPPPMGKRTEEAGKVINFSAQQIKLQCTDGTGTWLVTRTPTLTIIGSLEVGSTVTVKDFPWLTQVPATN